MGGWMIWVPHKLPLVSPCNIIPRGLRLGPHCTERHQPIGQPMPKVPARLIGLTGPVPVPTHSHNHISVSVQIRSNTIVLTKFLLIYELNGIPLFFCSWLIIINKLWVRSYFSWFARKRKRSSVNNDLEWSSLTSRLSLVFFVLETASPYVSEVFRHSKRKLVLRCKQSSNKLW